MHLKGEADIIPNDPLSVLTSRTYRRWEEWVDSCFRGSVTWGFHDKPTAGIMFDFDGFDIVDGSTLTWNVLAEINYKLEENISLTSGYHIFDIYYDTVNGNEEFGMDLQFKGLIFSLSILF